MMLRNLDCYFQHAPMQGPNYVWHLDGYDKLKPYGFAIHACIDGFVHPMQSTRIVIVKSPQVFKKNIMA